MLTKLMIKLKAPDGRYVHKHLTYIPTELLFEFEIAFKIPVSMRVRTWVKEDFGIILETPDDLKNFKKNVFNLFKAKYPELMMNENTALGLTQNWIAQHIKEEVHELKRLNNCSS